MPGCQVLATSATTGDGLDELRAAAGQRRGRAATLRRPGWPATSARRRGRAAGRRRRRRAGRRRRRATPSSSTRWPAAPGCPTVVEAVERDYRDEAVAQHRVAVHPLGAARCVPTRCAGCGSTAVTVAESSPSPRRRALGARPLVAAAADPGRPRCGRPRHPRRRPTAPLTGCRTAWAEAVVRRRRPRRSASSGDALDRPSWAPRCGCGRPCGGGSSGIAQLVLALGAVVGLVWLAVVVVVPGGSARPGHRRPADLGARAGTRCCMFVGRVAPRAGARPCPRGWPASVPAAAAGSSDAAAGLDRRGRRVRDRAAGRAGARAARRDPRGAAARRPTSEPRRARRAMPGVVHRRLCGWPLSTGSGLSVVSVGAARRGWVPAAPRDEARGGAP